MALFFQLLVERSLAWRPSLVLICFMTLGESLLLSGPPISLKLPPTLKLFNFAEKLMQLQDWPIYWGRLAEVTRTWVNLSSVMGGMRRPIYWVTFIPLSSVANYMTQAINIFLKLSWDSCPNSWLSLKIRDGVNAELVGSSPVSLLLRLSFLWSRWCGGSILPVSGWVSDVVKNQLVEVQSRQDGCDAGRQGRTWRLREGKSKLTQVYKCYIILPVFENCWWANNF